MASADEMKVSSTKSVESDSRFAWAQNDVAIEHKNSLANVKITSLGRFASIEDERDLQETNEGIIPR